jgi:hypothetical protein
MDIEPGTMNGRIGPFWWYNAICYPFEVSGLCGLASNPSRHLVWREGGCGLGSFVIHSPLRWRVLKVLD